MRREGSAFTTITRGLANKMNTAGIRQSFSVRAFPGPPLFLAINVLRTIKVHPQVIARQSTEHFQTSDPDSIQADTLVDLFIGVGREFRHVRCSQIWLCSRRWTSVLKQMATGFLLRLMVQLDHFLPYPEYVHEQNVIQSVS